MRYSICVAIYSLLFLSSCDVTSHFEHVIQNNTDKNISFWFYRSSASNYPKDTFIVEAHSSKQLFISTAIGGWPEPTNPVNGLDSVHTVIDGHRLKKSMIDSANWNYIVHKYPGKRSGNGHLYTFTVDSTDIE